METLPVFPVSLVPVSLFLPAAVSSKSDDLELTIWLLFLAGPGRPGDLGDPPGLPSPGLAVPAAVSSKLSAPNLMIWSETREILGTLPVSLFLLLSAPNCQLQIVETLFKK